MDLAVQVLEVAPWRPEEYERARAGLRAAMAESGPRPLSPAGNRRRVRLGTRGKVGVGAGIATVVAGVAGVAVLLAATSTPPTTPAGAQAGAQAKAGSHPPAAGSPVNSKLMSLAAFIMAGRGSLPGDASLIIRDQSAPDGPAEITYNLYADTGAYYVVDAAGAGSQYVAAAKKALTKAVRDHEDLAYGGIREVAAARSAATGDLAAARKRMTEAIPGNDYYDSLAERKAIWAKGAAARAELEKEKHIKVPLTMPTGATLREDIDDTIWDSSFDALSQGAGSPRVRAGVLRLLSTVPEVTIADSTTGGQPTLTLTADFFNDGTEVLTVDAKTGMPISFASNLSGASPALDTFQVSRVTMAAVRSGTF